MPFSFRHPVVFYGGIISLILLILIGLGFGYAEIYRSTEHQTTIKLTDKQRITSKNSGYYLIYTAGPTYTIKDTFVFGRFNSSDLYGHLQVGKTYNCEVAGWRIPLFSKYQNIINCKGV